jgi:nicotinamide-nucleotide amidase
MQMHEPSLERIKAFFASRRITMSENNLRQAMLPAGGIVLDNNCGTAPGVVVETAAGKIIAHLPGPPHEMRAMFQDSLAPYLKERFGGQGIIVSKVLRSFGLGESLLEDKIREYILNQSNPTIALLARHGEIHIRLTAKAATESEARELIGQVENKIRPLLAEYIFGTDEERLAEVTGKLLSEKNLTLALAESCTGGLMASLLTDIPGSSAYFKGGAVCYDNSIKTQIAQVPAQIIAAHGAVSKETAIYLAEGIKKVFNADIGVGITGIAGPEGGTEEKPVGLVFIAVAGQDTAVCHKHHFTSARADNKHRAALSAINHLRKFLLDPK